MNLPASIQVLCSFSGQMIFEKTFKNGNKVSIILKYLYLKKGVALHLYELIPSPKDACAQFGYYWLDKNFQKILIIFPWKRVWAFIITNMTSIQRCFVQIFIESGTLVLENKLKVEKNIHIQTDAHWTKSNLKRSI